MSKKKITIAMAGGGTGGHVFPVKSIIEYIAADSISSSKIDHIYRFGSSKSLEQEVCSSLQKNQKNLTFLSILSGKYRRETLLKSRLKNVRDFFLFFLGIRQAFFLLLTYRVDVIFCKGGYVALPVVVAGAFLRKKIIVHESDVHPGMVNKIASKFATKSFTGFENVFPEADVVGQILSDEILSTSKDFSYLSPSVQKAISSLDTSKTSVFVMGGSQGSKKLYQALAEALTHQPDLQKEVQFFIVLGKLNQEIGTLFQSFSSVQTFDFLSQKEIGAMTMNCDLALTRAGTTSLAEQKLYDMKLLIVPIPWTHDQYDNAKFYAQKYGDISLNQRDDDFQEQLEKVLLDHISFKKKLTDKDRKAEIGFAKAEIVKSFFER